MSIPMPLESDFVNFVRFEALQGGFGERGEFGQNGQGAGIMASKKPGSREQSKLI